MLSATCLPPPAESQQSEAPAAMAGLHRLLTAIDGGARFARDNVQRVHATFGRGWAQDLTEAIDHLYPEDPKLLDAVRGYGAFAMDSMRRQKRFERDGRYPAKTHAEATAEVYLNDEHMRSQYLPGLLLSHFLWPHHYRQLQYFRHFFLSAWPREAVVDFAEVGVGTGLYSRLALQALPLARGMGFDISPLSLQFTQDHVCAFGATARYQARLHDVLQVAPAHRHAAVICVEVLEHLEDPKAMLHALRALTAPQGKLFVTAALNAANADHIHLYRSPQEVFDQVIAAGLHVEHSFHALAYAPAAPGLPVPSALAMVLSPLP